MARRRRYITLLPKAMNMDWLQPGRVRKRFLKQSGSLAGLAQQLGVDAAGLQLTVDTFNDYAAAGVDKDYHRGENSYDLLYGDVRLGPNSCLAPLVEPPFYGVEVFPGDIGTKGGLLTNANAQVLAEDGEAIAGLYAIGNSSASVTGRYYPGAGATLGPAMTFGYVAANHIAAQ